MGRKTLRDASLRAEGNAALASRPKAAAEFQLDRPTPMSPLDALRNFTRYTGQSQRTAWDMLNEINKYRKKKGKPPFLLPRRPR